MPGIVLIVDFKKRPSSDNGDLLLAMAKSITHKEWQITETYLSPPLYAARVHLGFKNDQPQPAFNEDGSVCGFMDGEIFNSEDWKHEVEADGHVFKTSSDVESCVHFFERSGDKFVRALDGSFLLVLYDKKNEKVFIVNDRHGLIPFYYFVDSDRMLFFSEPKAVLNSKSFKKEIDDVAVADFFAFGRILGNRTLLKRVRMMPPASIITLSSERVIRRKYWSFRFKEDNDQTWPEDYYVQKLAILLRRAVYRRMSDNRSYGLFLSGGLDSRAILGAMSKKHHINTLTFGVKGGDEMKTAKEVAKVWGTNHVSVELKRDYLASFAQEGVYQTDGMLNCAHFHWISLLESAKRKSEVMFHGLGMEFLLSTVLSRSTFYHFFGEGSGLLHERQMARASDDEFPELLFRFFNGLVTEETMPAFYSDDYYHKIRDYPRRSFERYLKTIKEKDPVNRVDSFWLHFFGSYYMSRTLLRNYCEDRVPSLDNDFFDFALTVPRKYRFRSQSLYFKLLKRLDFSLAKVVYQRTGVAPIMPSVAHKIGFLAKGGYKFLTRKLRQKSHGLLALPERIGYPDYGEWIRQDRTLRAFFMEILLSKKTLSRGYFNPSFITKMVREHMDGKRDWTAYLCALVTFELWNRLFID